MKLNIANKLTLARIVLVPFFAFFIIYPVFTYEHTTWSRIIAAAIFILAAITDFLDGKIARKKQIITHFGKFMDPLADKFMILERLSPSAHRTSSSPTTSRYRIGFCITSFSGQRWLSYSASLPSPRCGWSSRANRALWSRQICWVRSKPYHSFYASSLFFLNPSCFRPAAFSRCFRC